MRKLLFVILFLQSYLIYAQQFRGGVIAGVVTSQVAGDQYSGFKKAGVSGGFFTSMNLSATTSVELDLIFIQKGSRFNADPELPGFQNYLLRLNYADLPFVIQYKLAGIIFEGGLSASFLLSSFEEKVYQEIMLNDWKRICFNTVFGIRKNLHKGWFVQFRTINSINSIRKNAVVGNVKRYFSGYGEFNDVLQLSFGYHFNLASKQNH